MNSEVMQEVYYLLPSSIDDELYRFMVALPIAAALAVMTSYISSKFLCLPKIDSPEKELLDELQTVKEILERGYALQGDNKEQCKEFVKEVVRYYIQRISSDHNNRLDKPNAVVIDLNSHNEDPSAPLLPESNSSTYGAFFPRASRNDKVLSIIIEPAACSKLTN